MNVFFKLNKYIVLISFLKYIIFNTIAEKCCTKGKNVKKNNVCCGSKNVEKEKDKEPLEEIEKSDDHYKNDDKDKQKELQKLKELEEKKEKEKLKDLIDNYKKRLVKINSEIKILKGSIKEYFDKKKFVVSVTENEINNITDLDNEEVGKKLNSLENKKLKDLKNNILKYLKNKFLDFKSKDKDNKLNIKDKDITDLENSENIITKELIALYNNLNTFEFILNGNITDIINKIKEIYNELNDKKNLVIEIINDESLDEKDIDDNNENQFDLDKENINNVDNEEAINNLVLIKLKLDNLKTKFICKFDKKKLKTKEYYDSLIGIYNDLKDDSKIEKIKELTVLNLNFDQYLNKYDDFNKKIKQFELDFIKKIEECTKDYLDNIKKINEDVDSINEKIESKNSEIDNEIKTISKDISTLNNNIIEFNNFIKELQIKNGINNDIFEEINEIDDIEKESYKISLVPSLNDDDKFKSDKGAEDDNKTSGDEKNIDTIKRLCEKLKYIKSNIDKINEYIGDANDKLKDDKLAKEKEEINKEKDNLKERKKRIEEYFKTNIFNIFTGLSEEDKNNFNGSEKEISFDKISEIYENFKTIKNKQLGLGYEKSSNDFINKIIDEYESKIIRKLLSPLNKFEVPIDEKKYKKYDTALKKFKKPSAVGSFGKIYIINNNYVLKVIDKKADLYDDEDIKNEILISYIFDKDPNIVELNDYFEYDNKIYLKLKYYAKGDLVDTANKEKIKKEDKDKIYYQIITALSKLHKRGIAHRDIKLENIFVDENYNICLADFGQATIYDTNKKYMLDSNTFSFPDKYVKLFYKLVNEDKELEDQMDLFKNDIFALGLAILIFEFKRQTPDIYDENFLKKRNEIIKKKDNIQDKDLKELLNIMLSQDLKVGNNIDVILGSNYYKKLEKTYGKKS